MFHVPSSTLLLEVAARQDVKAALTQAQDACTRLRFHEGLRRGWEEARAEAAVREATAVAHINGACIHVNDLRLASMHPQQTPVDAAQALAMGIWKAQWNITSLFDPLNSRIPTTRHQPPVAALTARIHRDICSPLLTDKQLTGTVRTPRTIPMTPNQSSGRLPEASTNNGTSADGADMCVDRADTSHDSRRPPLHPGIELHNVARPRSTDGMKYALELMRADIPAAVCAAALVAHFRVCDIFTPASGAVGATLARWLLVKRGTEPTGVAVISAADSLDAPTAAQALAGWASGNADGVAAWMKHFAYSLEYACEVGSDVAQHIQARRL